MDYDKLLASMVGQTMTSVRNVNNEELLFTAMDGRIFKFYHSQDCCESVMIEDVCGDLDDIVGEPLLQAEEISSADEPEPKCSESYTWTFYKFATIKGSVTVRWLGTSNGYYSESVNLELLNAA